MSAEKVRENRLRRIADRRRGWRVIKSRARDPQSLTFGCYGLIDAMTNTHVSVSDPVGRGYPFSDLDEVEAYLTS